MKNFKKKSKIKFSKFFKFFKFFSKDDSDYEMNEEDTPEKKKRSRKINNRAAKEIRFGKINVVKFFTLEKMPKPDENNFPNFNNIIVKPSQINRAGTTNTYKICNVCFGFANYTCPRCSDRYCSKDCYKTHREVKCVKYLEL